MIGLCVLLAACSGATYSGPEWSARVVDAENGAPVEGAIVVARWKLERYSGRFAGWLFISEAVTNHDGVFHFPAWGPTAADADEGMRTRMSPNVPSIAIYKSNYWILIDGCCGLSGYLSRNYGSGPNTRPSWADGKVFALRPFYGDLHRYRDDLAQNMPLSGPSCIYTSIPRIYAAAIAENKRLQKELEYGIPDFTVEQFQDDVRFAKCKETVASSLKRVAK
ncbi:MAG: hypothetical protein ACRD5Z_25670 [Bryobacteraceae bacterium]